MSHSRILIVALALYTLTNGRMLFAGDPSAHSKADSLAVPALPEGVQVLFPPNEDAEAELVKLIGSARVEIVACFHALTSPAIAKALIEAQNKRQVLIALIFDPAPPLKNYRTPELLFAAGLSVSTFSGAGHNKNTFVVVDGTTVLTGSFEPTQSGSAADWSNAIILSEPAIAARFIEAFHKMAERSEPIVEASATPENNDPQPQKSSQTNEPSK